MKLKFCALALVLGGCVTTSEVVPTGPNSYLVNATARGGLDPGAQIIAATKKANDYCATMSKKMVLTQLNTAGVPMWTPEHSTLAFTCD